MRCTATNGRGEPCKAPESLVDERTGLCVAHKDGNEMAERARKGGEATRRKYETDGIGADDLVTLTTLEDAKLALDQIRRGVLTRQITHAEANAGSKAVSEWVKTARALLTRSLVNELQRELDDRTHEIDQLRTELARARVRPA